MKAWTRWQDWTNAVLGAYMLFVPLFTLVSSSDSRRAPHPGRSLLLMLRWC